MKNIKDDKEKFEEGLSDYLIPLVWSIAFLSLKNFPVFIFLLISAIFLTRFKRKLRFEIENPRIAERAHSIQNKGLGNVVSELKRGRIEQVDQEVRAYEKQVFILDNVKNKLSKVDDKTREKFYQIIKGLKDEGNPFVNISKLENFKDMLIFRVGRFRIIYKVENNKIIILDFFERNELGLREHGLLNKLLKLRKKLTNLSQGNSIR